MNSFRNRQRGPSLFGAFVAIVIALALLFGVEYLTGGVLREFARSAASASRALLASAGESVQGSGLLATRGSLARENEALKREIALHAEEISQVSFVREENAALQKMANLAEIESGLTARVLSSFRASPYGTFLIDAGERDGVRNGAAVLTEGGFVLGEITSVSANTATVRALFSPEAGVDLVAGESAFSAEGRGGGNAQAEVPRESPVAVGDIVRSPLFNGRAAGVILHIESASSSATEKLLIRIPVNLGTMRYVYVVPR